MKLYHGTTEDNWKKIQSKGFLGKGNIIPLFLAQSIYYAKQFGNVLLEVDYEPYPTEILEASIFINPMLGSFQVETKNIIPINKIKRIK